MWPTPTPMILPTPEFLGGFDATGFGHDFASGIVQGWNFFDAQGFAGIVWLVLLVLILLMGLTSIRSHFENL